MYVYLAIFICLYRKIQRKRIKGILILWILWIVLWVDISCRQRNITPTLTKHTHTHTHTYHNIYSAYKLFFYYLIIITECFYLWLKKISFVNIFLPLYLTFFFVLLLFLKFKLINTTIVILITIFFAYYSFQYFYIYIFIYNKTQKIHIHLFIIILLIINTNSNPNK